MDLAPLIRLNQRRWDLAKLTKNYISIAKSLVFAKRRYQIVAGRTGVPWFIIAVIHQREGAGRWNTQLGQGDPLNQVSTHVPAGRGPFQTWEDGAVDALTNCKPYASKWTDWSPGGAMTLLEQYNGLGYAYRAMPSPYVWSGTDQYVAGKFVADHVFDPTVVDAQPGCAALIKQMLVFDPKISFKGKP